MLEMGIRSRGRVGQNRKKIYSAPPSASALLGLGLLTSCAAGGPGGQKGAESVHGGTTGTPDSTLSRAHASAVAWRVGPCWKWEFAAEAGWSRIEQKIYSAPPSALPNGFCAGLCPSRRARSFEVSGRKNEKLEIRVSQHAPIFPLTMFSRGLIF